MPDCEITRSKQNFLEEATKIKDALLKLWPGLQKLEIKQGASNYPAFDDLRIACSSLYKSINAHENKTLKYQKNKDVLKVKKNSWKGSRR